MPFAFLSFIEIGLDHTLEELDGLGVSSQSDNGLLVVSALASGVSTSALNLALHTNGVDLSDLDAEDFLNSSLDLGLVSVEEIFGVKVAKVNTIRMQGKVKRTGAYPAGKRADYKKAVVTLTADSKTIEFFEGMV